MRSVDVRRWHRDGLLEAPDGDPDACTRRVWAWTDADGTRTASIRFETRPGAVVLDYVVTWPATAWDGEPECVEVRETVRLVRTPLHFGDTRPWFACPRCTRRAAVLYLTASPACRRCLGLTYRSRNQSRTDRAVDQCHKMQARHGGDGGALGGLGPKPVGMRWRTWEQHEARHERQRRRALASLARRLGVVL